MKKSNLIDSSKDKSNLSETNPITKADGNNSEALIFSTGSGASSVLANNQSNPSYIQLGNSGPFVSPIGFGSMQLSFASFENGKLPEDIIVKAVESGVNFIDTAAAYGSNRHNEKLVGKALKRLDRNKVIVATKCGIDMFWHRFTDLPEQIIKSVDESLQALETDYIDILYLHRINPKATPAQFDATISTLKQMVIQGKAKYIGLSEPTEPQIIQANNVEPKEVPITCVQSAYSITTRRAELNGVMKTCKDFGVGFVSYGSLTRGFMSTKLLEVDLNKIETLSDDKFRTYVFNLLGKSKWTDILSTIGSFSAEHLKKNVVSMIKFQKFALQIGVSPYQLALAWSISQGVVPIPGTTKEANLLENIKAIDIRLTQEQISYLNDILPVEYTGDPNPSFLSCFENPALDNPLSSPAKSSRCTIS